MTPQVPSTAHAISVDLTRIDNAEVRRALRQLMQQMQETITRQQTEIDALLELILEKHVGSLSEFKRNVVRLQQHGSERLGRVHHEMTPHAVTEPPVAAPARPVAPEAEEEDNGRRVYRL